VGAAAKARQWTRLAVMRSHHEGLQGGRADAMSDTLGRKLSPKERATLEYLQADGA